MHAFDPVIELDVRVDLDPPWLQAGQPIRWTFSVANRGRAQRALSFTSSQLGDVVLEAEGVERYRWSRGRLFAAVMREQELPAAEEWRFSLDDILSVEPGTYSLLATVMARPPAPLVRGEAFVHAGEG